MVPMLAWTEFPSERTKKANTTFKIDGTAPNETAHFIYPAVAAAFCSPAPSSARSGF